MNIYRGLVILINLVLIFLFLSCNEKPPDHLSITSSMTSIYDGQPLTVNFEYRFNDYNNLKAWAVIEGTSFKSSEYIVTEGSGYPPYNSSVFFYVPGPDDDPRLINGNMYDLCIRVGTGPNDYEQSCIYVTYTTSYVPPQDRINNIEFGATDNGNDGILENKGISFESPIYEIFYAAEFNSDFPERTKIRKTWTRAGETTPVLQAIQIVEDDDNKIWGVFKRHNSAPLDPGIYTLTIDEYSLNGTYETLSLENGTGTFVIVE